MLVSICGNARSEPLLLGAATSEAIEIVWDSRVWQQCRARLT